MSKLPLALVLLLAGMGTAVRADVAVPLEPNVAASGLLTLIGCNGSPDGQIENDARRVRRQGNCASNDDSSGSGDNRKVVNRRIVDCHRDVRTHRVYGRLLKHRHVGEDCAIREVRTSN